MSPPERSQRTGGVTHKIDPNTGLEREFIGKTMQQTGLVADLEQMTVPNPVIKAEIAHGEKFYSDGRTLIIYLLPDSVQR